MRFALPSLLLFVAVVGCSSPQDTSRGTGVLSGSLDDRTMTARELQLRLQDFVDVSSHRLDQASAQIVGVTTDPLVRLRAQQLAVYPRVSMMQIVSGPDPDAALLDLMVLTTAFGIVIEDYWIPLLFDEVREPVLVAVRRNEQDISSIADAVMSQTAQEELRELVVDWRRRNPDVTYVGSLRFREISTGSMAVGTSLQEAVASGGLVGNLRGTRQELQETRLLAERAMYFGQRLPDLLVSQAQISVLEVLNMPESQAALANAERVTAAAERVSTTVEALPTTLGTVLTEHEAALGGLLAEARQTAATTRELSESLQVTVRATDDLVQSVRPGPGREPGEVLAETRLVLQETTSAARELTTTADALERLLSSPGWSEDQPGLTSTLDRVDASSTALVELIFRRALMLLAAALVAALVYRLLSRKLA
jgi:hypothetical protein